jgi:hypothetical protein
LVELELLLLPRLLMLPLLLGVVQAAAVQQVEEGLKVVLPLGQLH